MPGTNRLTSRHRTPRGIALEGGTARAFAVSILAHRTLLRAIRQAVGVAISVASPAVVGCGGSTDSRTECGVTSDQPLARPCGEQSYAFHGSVAACGANRFGSLSPDQCAGLCPSDTQMGGGAPPATAGSSVFGCNVDWGANPLLLNCDYSVSCGNGRRPPGLRRPTRRPSASAVGALLAEIAHLEAASVVAFDVLARDLERCGAPARFRAASVRAGRDEVRHAAIMKDLAERAGARVAPVRVARRPQRTVEDMAVENAVEGCVGETFGAAVACFQAKRVTDRRIRSAMKPIAADEIRHAQLSWELARWFDRQLTPAARRRVRKARSHAVEALARSVAATTHSSAAAEIGLPTAVEAAALVDQLRGSVWALPSRRRASLRSSSPTECRPV
jgi:hypothetical protein